MTSITRHWTSFLALTAAAALAAPATALADSGHGDFAIGSSADGGGDLLAEYSFEVMIRTDWSGVGGLYTSETPGFGVSEDEPGEGIYELDVGTKVNMTLLDIDEGLSVLLAGGAGLLSMPGDTGQLGDPHDGVPGDDGALHSHPTFQLLLGTDPGEFGEGEVTFMLEDPDALYGSSEMYTLSITNGYLAPVEDATKDSANCQKQVGKQVATLISKNYKVFTKCLDAIQSAKVDGGDPTTDPKATKICADPDKGIVARVAENQQKAFDKVVDKCVGTFSAEGLSPHLGMASCRVEELIGAAYSSALEDIAEVVFADDEEAAEEAFPCIGESQGSTIPEEE